MAVFGRQRLARATTLLLLLSLLMSLCVSVANDQEVRFTSQKVEELNCKHRSLVNSCLQVDNTEPQYDASSFPQSQHSVHVSFCVS
jgi:hypothetical protein